MTNSRATSATVEKAFTILDLIHRKGRDGLTLSEVCAQVQMSKSTVHRYLATFEKLTVIERDEKNRYHPGLKLVELAGETLANIDFVSRSKPYMLELVGRFEETVNLAVPSGAEIVYVAKLESSQSLRMASQLGSRMPMSTTSLGKAILARFDDYWGGWQEGQFDRIILEAVADVATRLQMVQSGEADMTTSVPAEALPGLRADPNITVANEFAFLNWHWSLNTKHPPLDDVRVRQALAYSFPYNDCITVGGEMLARNDQPIPNGMFGNTDTLTTYDTDMDKAAELLAAAGHPDGGFDLLLTWFTGVGLQEKCAILWQSNLSQLGIGLEIQEMAWEALWELAKSDPTEPSVQDVEAGIWWPTYVTPYDYLYAIYHCEDEPFFNLSYSCYAELDEFIDTAFIFEATDPEKAEQLYALASQFIIDEALALHIADEKMNIIYRSDIEGYQLNPAYIGARVFFYNLSRSR